MFAKIIINTVLLFRLVLVNLKIYKNIFNVPTSVYFLLQYEKIVLKISEVIKTKK